MTEEENYLVTSLKYLGRTRIWDSDKHASSENPQAKATIERIHQVLGNLVHSYHLQETYTDYADPYSCSTKIF